MKEGEVVSRPLANLYYKWTTPDAMIACTSLPDGKESFSWQGGQLVPVTFQLFKDWDLPVDLDRLVIGPYRLRRVATRYHNETVVFTLDAPHAFWYVWRVRLIEALIKLVARTRRLKIPLPHKHHYELLGIGRENAVYECSCGDGYTRRIEGT